LHLQLKVISIFGSRLSGTVQVTKITTGASYLTDYASAFLYIVNPYHAAVQFDLNATNGYKVI
jgi:hypothetical protein